MKYSRRDLIQLPDYHLSFDELIEFSDDAFADFPRIKKLSDIRAIGEGDYNPEEQRLYLNLHVEGVMTCPSDITFKDVDIPFDSDADEIISFNKADSEDMEILKPEGGYIDMLSIILRQIIVEVPLKVKEEGEIEYPKGDGWQVMDEATYQAEKANRIDPRLAALKDYKPQDE